MKRLLLFLAFCIPIYLFAQGFGSFSHDQPYFAKDRVSASGRWWPTNTANQMFIWLELTPILSAGKDFTTGDGVGINHWTNLVSGSLFNADGAFPTNYTSGGGGNGTSPRVDFTSSSSTRMESQDFGKPTATFIVVANSSTPAAEQFIFVNGSGIPPYLRYRNSSLEISAGTLLSTPATITNDYYVITAVFNGASSRIDTNGVTAASGNAGSTSFGAAYLAQWQLYKGNICRVWAWTNILTTAEESSAVAQCKIDFGIP